MKKLSVSLLALSVLAGCASSNTETATTPLEPTANTKALMAKLDPNKLPGENFDLTNWKITLPMLETEGSRKGKAKEIQKENLSSYSHPTFFYTDKEDGSLVFNSPNTAPTTPNSKNARSELRGMLASHYGEPKNNFVIASHPNAAEYGAIGGTLKATLAVDWVSTSGNHRKVGAHAVVIGQIHAAKNEPLKIVYRKLPGHETGSLHWSYELNPVPEKQNYRDSSGSRARKDIRHDVFGKYNLRKDDEAPVDGIKLGEVFSYEVNVKGDVMHLTFIKNPGEANEVVKTFEKNLAEKHYQGHQIDEGYQNTWMYFKAGVYNQCNTKQSSSGCSYGGLDSEDYTQARFYELTLDQ